MLPLHKQSFFCTRAAVFHSGCGVFATCEFAKTEFLLEYRGELIDGDEGEKRYKSGESGTFLYFFEVEGRKKMW